LKGSVVKLGQLFAASVLSVGACVLSPGARADTVLYEGTGFLQGTQSFVESFYLSTPGTLTVTLTNVAWPEQLSSLNFLLTAPGAPMRSEMGAGTEKFEVKEGEFFAQWFGTAQGPLNTGVYSMKIDFQPAAAPVPIPTSIVLLLSGLALLLWQRRAPATPRLDWQTT
jgi:hypothetical protein